MKLEDKFPPMSDEAMEAERQDLEERNEWWERWHPALGPQCGGPRGSELDSFKL